MTTRRFAGMTAKPKQKARYPAGFLFAAVS
jgi:hypothetical protein